MATKVFGHYYDLIEFDGDFIGEVGCYAGDDDENGSLIVMSDGTLMDVRYGKKSRGIWKIDVLRKGLLFDRLDICDDEDADPYSDVAHFKNGIKWAYHAREWSIVS